jgi:hypothetical protein
MPDLVDVDASAAAPTICRKEGQQPTDVIGVDMGTYNQAETPALA